MRASFFTLALLIISAFCGAGSAGSQQATSINITVRNGQFSPAEINGAAGTPFILRVENLDSTVLEFSSPALRAHATISPNTREAISVNAMPPGRYTFFDVSRSGTQGVLILK